MVGIRALKPSIFLSLRNNFRYAANDQALRGVLNAALNWNEYSPERYDQAVLMHIQIQQDRSGVTWAKRLRNSETDGNSMAIGVK
jgi:hypothetical protein